MAKQVVNLRAEPDEVTRWKDAAKAEGVSLSEWVRSRCAPPDHVDLTVVTDAIDRAKGRNPFKAVQDVKPIRMSPGAGHRHSPVRTLGTKAWCKCGSERKNGVWS
jgi:hypothetical protein